MPHVETVVWYVNAEFSVDGTVVQMHGPRTERVWACGCGGSSRRSVGVCEHIEAAMAHDEAEATADPALSPKEGQ